jgi:hypothetical protein
MSLSFFLENLTLTLEIFWSLAVFIGIGNARNKMLDRKAMDKDSNSEKHEHEFKNNVKTATVVWLIGIILIFLFV